MTTSRDQRDRNAPDHKAPTPDCRAAAARAGSSAPREKISPTSSPLVKTAVAKPMRCGARRAPRRQRRMHDRDAGTGRRSSQHRAQDFGHAPRNAEPRRSRKSPASNGGARRSARSQRAEHGGAGEQHRRQPGEDPTGFPSVEIGADQRDDRRHRKNRETQPDAGEPEQHQRAEKARAGGGVRGHWRVHWLFRRSGRGLHFIGQVGVRLNRFGGRYAMQPAGASSSRGPAALSQWRCEWSQSELINSRTTLTNFCVVHETSGRECQKPPLPRRRRPGRR